MNRPSSSVDVLSVGTNTDAAFARSLRDRLVSLGDDALLHLVPDEVYDVPPRIFSESSSTGCLAKQVPEVLVPEPNGADDRSDGQFRRCSSLKTWKTPPGTPGGKKIVRFADALGLDLADVRTFLDEIPKIPSSAYVDLECDLTLLPSPSPPPPNPTLIPKFIQPVNRPDFFERLNDLNVLLESATLTDAAVFTVSGTIRVRNISYEKCVHVRYTNDRWTSFSDLRATYVPNSCDGPTDRFSFVLYAHTLRIGDSLEFAIRYDSVRDFWDNNEGRNYVFECVPQAPGTWRFGDIAIPCESPWTASFY